MTVEARKRVERRIARSFVVAALATGFSINILNGGDDWELPENSNNLKTIMANMMLTDEEKVYIFKPGDKKSGGWALFIYGNDGYDVIADHTISPHMEAIMVEPNKLSERLEPLCR